MVFIKNLKLIDGDVILSLQIIAPSNSNFVFILTPNKVYIVTKEAFVQYFCSIRMNLIEEIPLKQDLISSQQLFQNMAHVQQLHWTFADFNYLKQDVVEKNYEVQVNKNKKITVKSLTKQILDDQIVQVIKTEILCCISNDTAYFYGLIQERFQLCYSFHLDNAAKFQIYGKLFMFLCANKFYIYEINFGFPFNQSNHELLHQIDFSPLVDDIHYFSQKGVYFYSDFRIYKLEVKDNFVQVPVMMFSQDKKQNNQRPIQQQENKILSPENNQLFESEFGSIFTIDNQLEQKIYFQIDDKVSQLNLAERDKLSAMAFSISPHIYEYNGKPHYIFIFQIQSQKNEERENLIIIYKYSDESLEAIICIEDFKTDIAMMYFVSPYDLIYLTENKIGIIQFKVDELGIVIA